MVRLKKHTRSRKPPTPVADGLVAAGAIEAEALTMNDFDDCILGVCTRFGQPALVAYDYELVIQKLIAMGCADRAEAEEYHEFNQVGAGMGDYTPVFIRKAQDIIF